MKIISIYSLKGGVGKTTITYQLLYALKERGFKVIGIDMDRRKGLSDLLRNSDIECYQVDGLLTKNDVVDLGCDYVVIDGTPEVNDDILKSMSISDYLITPLEPDNVDINLFTGEFSRLFYSKLHNLNPTLKTSILLNKVTPFNLDVIKKLKTTLLDDIKAVMPSLDTKNNFIAEIGLRQAFKVKIDENVLNKNNNKAKNEILYFADRVIEAVL